MPAVDRRDPFATWSFSIVAYRGERSAEGCAPLTAGGTDWFFVGWTFKRTGSACLIPAPYASGNSYCESVGGWCCTGAWKGFCGGNWMYPDPTTREGSFRASSSRSRAFDENATREEKRRRATNDSGQHPSPSRSLPLRCARRVERSLFREGGRDRKRSSRTHIDTHRRLVDAILVRPHALRHLRAKP